MTDNLSLTRIRTRLHKVFDNQIPASSYKPYDDDKFVSQALCALYLAIKAGIPSRRIGEHITDGFDDGGVDAVYHDQNAAELYLIQGKLKHSANKAIGPKDLHEFFDGVDALLKLDFSPFNQLIRDKETEITDALEDINTKVVLVLLHTSGAGLSQHAERKKKKFLEQQNNLDEIIQWRSFGIKEISAMARSSSRQQNIDLDFILHGWGALKNPYKAFYGSVAAEDVVSWHNRFSNQLFSENIRYVLSGSEVNEQIISTIQNEPESLWYFNNGITAICNDVDRAPMGGSSTQSGLFKATSVSIVNGAQTVGACVEADRRGAQLTNCYLHFRVIGLHDTPDAFAYNVTKATNTQNQVTAVDFVSLDDAQDRLKHELSTLGWNYVIRRGEGSTREEEECSLREATVALACSNEELRYAVLAKRYISSLWQDTSRAPYTDLFNENVTGVYLRNLIRCMRAIDAQLEKLAQQYDGRHRLLAIHGNRFIAHCVFYQNDLFALESKHCKVKNWMLNVAAEAQKIFDDLLLVFDSHFADSYPGNLFKNETRQFELKQELGYA